MLKVKNVWSYTPNPLNAFMVYSEKLELLLRLEPYLTL
jgi:hypothetical protein